MEPLTFSETYEFGPMIYGLVDIRDGKVVYVGKTKNPRRRFESYRYSGGCHNPQLSEWLKQTGEHVRVLPLEINPPDLDKSERAWISRLRQDLFNLVDGGEQAWRKHVSYPWMAGTGIKCPSDLLILELRNRKSQPEILDKVKVLRKSMSTLNRVLFEVSLCMDMWKKFRYRANLERWLSRTEERILNVLEASQNRTISGCG